MVTISETLAKLFAALGVGAASLTVTCLSVLPDLSDTIKIAQIYAKMAQNAAFGTFGAFLLAGSFWSVSQEWKMDFMEGYFEKKMNTRNVLKAIPFAMCIGFGALTIVFAVKGLLGTFNNLVQIFS